MLHARNPGHPPEPATAIAVPISRRAGFGSVLGYLLAGIVIGPPGLRLVTDVEQIAHVSGLGVVMLLFLIGLELRPQRLWVMRARCSAWARRRWCQPPPCCRCSPVAGVAWAGRGVLGPALRCRRPRSFCRCSRERDLLTSPRGPRRFAVLLFQDLAFIPLVALVPLLAGGGVPDHVPWLEVAGAARRASPPSCSAAASSCGRCSAPSAARRRRRSSPPSRC